MADKRQYSDVPDGVVARLRPICAEVDVLRHTGHPFFYAGWGRDVIGMVMDAATDWTEVAELLTESYCVMAPQRLAALVDRPHA